MADTTLKTNYKDDVLDTSVNDRRKYQMIQNEDGTVSFVDVTEYSQVGDSFGSADINATNEVVSKLNSEKVGFPDYSNRKSFASGDTMTSDGYVRIGVRASENRFISITVNGVVAYMGGVIPLSGSSNYDMSPLIPVKAGDVVTYSTNVTEATGTQFGSVAHFFALRK